MCMHCTIRSVNQGGFTFTYTQPICWPTIFLLLCRRKFWKASEELLNYLIDVGQRFHLNSSDGNHNVIGAYWILFMLHFITCMYTKLHT